MAHVHAGHHKGGILLTGDPGVGKTTFVEMMGALLGIKTIIIEVPHITEEHLINIPFIVFNPQTNSSSTQKSQMGPDYKLILAQSNLYTQIASPAMMNDQEYLAHIKQSPRYIQQLFQHFGGNENSIPREFQEIRSKFKTLLFLDEYYRQTSTRIRNILRGILNGRLGLHNIPQHCYTMYASNMRDTGLEEIPSNQQFTAIEYRTPTAKDWFGWFEAKYANHPEVHVNPQVLDQFKQLLKDEDISFQDIQAEVRTSPRRWEQILLYIGSSLPLKEPSEARALLTNVKNAFIHYQSGKHSKLADKVMKATAELIRNTSQLKMNEGDLLGSDEWRSSLMHAVERQMQLGEYRKHIPVVSGPPGIGKTAQAFTVAARYNLRLIDIDVSEVFSEDVIGLPLPEQKEKEEMAVKFSLPKLYQQIMNQIHEKDEQYIAELKEKHGERAKEHIQKYFSQRWKYLIFFDEINRVDDKTFNALRKVILEKNFGPAGDESGKLLKLPKEAIVVAAMNPEGVGTSELTHHFRDVIDVIPASANWEHTKQWLMSRNYEGIPEDVKTTALNIMQAFVDKFKDNKKKPNEAPFHLDVGAPLYVSPREYTDMFSTLVREIHSGLKQAMSDPDVQGDRGLRVKLDEIVGEALEDSLNFIFYKHTVEKEEFLNTLRNWVQNLDDRLFTGLISKLAKGISKMAESLSGYLDGKNVMKMPDDIEIININNSVNNSQFIEEVKELFTRKFTDDAALKKYIIDENQPKVDLQNDKLVATKDKASLLTNFVLGLLFTLHVHQYQNDRLTSVGRALSVSLSEIMNNLAKEKKVSPDVKNDAVVSTVQLRSDIHDLISKL